MTGVIASDLDGTLIFGGRAPDPAVRAEIEAAAGDPEVRMVLATSRSPRCLREWFGPLLAACDILCFNGALVVSAGVEITRRPMDARVLAAMIELLTAAGEPFCVDYGDYFASNTAAALPWMGTVNRRVIRPGGRWNLRGALKLSIAHADPWAVRLADFAGATVEVYPHLTGDADVVAAGATKADGLRTLLAGAGGVGWGQVVALGNDANDVGMLREAGRAYVVGEGLVGLERLGHVRRLPAQVPIVAASLRLERQLARYDTDWACAGTGSDGAWGLASVR